MRLVNDSPDTTFGNSNGSRLYGGCEGSVGQGCTTVPGAFPTAHIPTPGALFADGSGVYVAGRTLRLTELPNDNYREGLLAHIDPASGNLTSLQNFRWSYSMRITGLVPGRASSDGRREFTAVGFAHTQTGDSGELNPDKPADAMTAYMV